MVADGPSTGPIAALGTELPVSLPNFVVSYIE